MKIATLLTRTLPALTALSARVLLALASLSAPIVLSSILAEPAAAQAKAAPGTGSGSSGPVLVESWVRPGSNVRRVGLTPYRTSFEVRFSKYCTSPGVYQSTCDVHLVSFQKRILGFWHDVTPSSTTASGSFSGPRAATHYVHTNPFSGVSVSAQWLRHFDDTSGTGFQMTHGNYSMTCRTGSSDITAQVAW